MISRLFFRFRPALLASRKHLSMLAFVGFLLLCCATWALAQDTSQQPPANPNKQEAPPEAGGPQNDIGPYVIPKKKEEPPPPAPEIFPPIAPFSLASSYQASI